jgi:hypothetical protein
VSVAVAEFPSPASTDVTALVVFTLVPPLVPVTLTEKLHWAPAASVALERETVPLPAVAVRVPPPQDPTRLFGVETTRPVGNVSVNPTPSSVVGLPPGLVIVKVRVLLPLIGIEDGAKVLEIVGGTAPAT